MRRAGVLAGQGGRDRSRNIQDPFTSRETKAIKRFPRIRVDAGVRETAG